ncbi:MAG: carbon storage regulator CsrA [Tissierellia bacterium]|nr:carbon storage regulator CsrA [Tissierellia bacterium]
MLILSRKEEESIIINGNIEVKVLEIGEGKVRLGIKAPKDVDIFREEIYKSIQEANIQAAKAKVDIKEMGKLFNKNGKNE